MSPSILAELPDHDLSRVVTLTELVMDTIEAHLEVQRGSKVNIGVACSGGIDSITLAACLWLISRLQTEVESAQPEVIYPLIARCRAAPTVEVLILTVDHGLYDGSARQASELAAFWRQAEVSCEVLCADPEVISRGAGLEDGARRARYQVLTEAAERAELDLIYLGHHAGDQAETMIMRLQSPAGLLGMRGIPPRRDRFVRPWLTAQPCFISSAHRSLALPVFLDPTNSDERFKRNAVRHRVTPALNEVFGTRWVSRAAQTASHLREDERALSLLLDELLRDHLSISKWRGVASLSWPQGLTRPRAIRRAALRELYRRALYTLTSPDSDRRRARDQLPILEEVWEGEHHQQRSLPLGLIAWGGRGELELFMPALAPSIPDHVTLTLPPATAPVSQLNTLTAQWGEWTLSLTPISTHRSSHMIELRAESGAYLGRAGQSLTLTLPPQGARYQPQGTSGSKRVRRLWSDRQRSLFERARLPALTDERGRVLWIPYCRPAAWLCTAEQPIDGQAASERAWMISWEVREREDDLSS